MHRKITPRRVDFQRNREDLQALVLGSLGFSTDYIIRQTGLSPSQVTYRLKKGEIKRADYRNGGTAFSQLVVTKIAPTIAANVRRQVNGEIKKRRNGKGKR